METKFEKLYGTGHEYLALVFKQIDYINSLLSISVFCQDFEIKNYISNICYTKFYL